MLIGLGGIFILAGCGIREIHAAGDPDEVTEVLTAALEAWQAGQKPDELGKEDPAMHIADGDWAAGKTLKSFQPLAAPVKHGGEWRVSTVLTISDAGKAEEQKTVDYSVTVAPAIVITRSDEIN